MSEYKKTKKVKERILLSAISLFSAKGYDSVKVEEIAADAGVAKGLVFYHFVSKEGLLTEIIHSESKEMFSGFMEFIKNMPPDYALFQMFQGMFASTQPLSICQGFFEGDIPEKYHYAVDRAREETVFPVIHNLIKQGFEQNLFHLEEVDISYDIISRGFNSFLNTHFHLFEDILYHERFLKSAAYILNSTLNPARFKFEFQIHNEGFVQK